MADKKVLVRHDSGYPAGIGSGDTATAPAFKATNTGATVGTIDANNGKVINVAAGEAPTDAVNKSQLDSAVNGRVPTSRTITAGNGLTGGGDLSANRTINVGAGAGIAVSTDTVAVKGDQTKGIVVDSVAGVQARIGTGLKFRTADGAIEAEGTGAIQPGGYGDNGIALITSGQSLNQSDDMLHVHGVEFVPDDTYWLLDGDPVYASAAALNALVDGSNADGLHTHGPAAAVYTTATAGEAIAVGNAVAIDPADGKAWKAANTAARAGFVGFAYTAAAADEQVKIVQAGAINPAGVSAVGQYWLGTTPGVLVNAPPATGRQVRVGFKSTVNFCVAIADFGEV